MFEKRFSIGEGEDVLIESFESSVVLFLVVGGDGGLGLEEGDVMTVAVDVGLGGFEVNRVELMELVV